MAVAEMAPRQQEQHQDEVAIEQGEVADARAEQIVITPKTMPVVTAITFTKAMISTGC